MKEEEERKFWGSHSSVDICVAAQQLWGLGKQEEKGGAGFVKGKMRSRDSQREKQS